MKTGQEVRCKTVGRFFVVYYNSARCSGWVTIFWKRKQGESTKEKGGESKEIFWEKVLLSFFPPIHKLFVVVLIITIVVYCGKGHPLIIYATDYSTVAKVIFHVLLSLSFLLCVHFLWYWSLTNCYSCYKSEQLFLSIFPHLAFQSITMASYYYCDDNTSSLKRKLLNVWLVKISKTWESHFVPFYCHFLSILLLKSILAATASQIEGNNYWKQ